jgi:hypothetical protein
MVRIKGMLDLDRQDADETISSEDELDESQEDRPARRRPKGQGLGSWEKIGWMAAGLCRRVPGVEFM